jgi:alkyl hydroperoxide reductase subunit AhpC
MAWDNGRFKKVSLADYRGKYVVLFFWPLDFTFVCPTEIIEYGDAAPRFAEENGCVVLGCSIDSHFVHREWTLKSRDEGGLGAMQIPLVSDITKQISKDYGVLIDSGNDAGVALRGTFIIDDKGNLRHMTVNDLPVGRNVNETLRLVQAFQYSDQFGEVCPSSWTPGAKTMVPDHDSEKLQEFWRDH